MGKKKIYCSGGAAKEVRAATQAVKDAGWIPLTYAILPEEMEQADYIKIRTAMIDASDMVVMLPGWGSDKTARFELDYADQVGKPHMELEEFQERYSTTEVVKPQPPARSAKTKVERMFGARATWSSGSGGTPANSRNAHTEEQEEQGATGFMLFKCEVCGAIKGFCAKKPMRTYICKACGQEKPLPAEIIPAFADCEKCGRTYKYRTNIIQQEPLEISCINCGAPIAMEINRRGTALVTMPTRGGGRVK